MNLYGVDFGEKLDCRVCRGDRFIVERGTGTVNGEGIGVLTIRCSRCGTVLEQLQVDWKASVGPEDQVRVNDGIVRETDLVAS